MVTDEWVGRPKISVKFWAISECPEKNIKRQSAMVDLIKKF